ncbi:hypothetical protein ACF0H5_000677 [Mactra antiquata]
MDIEELESVDESIERSILYDDTLYHKINNKLKQLRVELRRGIANDGSKVFKLDIRGVKHKYQFSLDFSPRELCFLQMQERQDFVKSSSCWSCIDRNYYPSMVYSRILLVLYLEADDDNEAKCIKVPFIQRGNMNSVTKLRKLHQCIMNNCVSADELKHWSVYVVRCGDKSPGQSVYLCLTKYAFIIIHEYSINHYHAYHNSEISIHCSHEHHQIQFTIHDSTLREFSGATENFSLHKVYTFKTYQTEHIERSFNDLRRKSSYLPKHIPAPHYNIHHSELSASVQIGTTSDNVTIVPHKPLWNDNNNSGSDSLVDASFDKLLNTIDPPFAHTPSWHSNLAYLSTSSNGSVPGMGVVEIGDLFATHNDVIRHSAIARASRDKWPDDGDIDNTETIDSDAGGGGDGRIEVEFNIEATKDEVMNTALEDCPSPHLPQYSDPLNTATSKTLTHKKKSSLPDMEHLFRDNSVDTLRFVTEEEASDLPPPPPCPAFSQPFGEFPKKSEYLTNIEYHSSPIRFHDEPNVVPALRRFKSFLDVPEQVNIQHYVNVSQKIFSQGSIHDDFPYYRFYYNVGMIRSEYSRVSQRKKLQRINRLSKELRKVDLNDLDIHEQWYDRDFTDRYRDSKFCQIYNIRQEQETYSDIYSRVEEDDPYWTQNDLCITIQRLLEEEPKDYTLFTEVQNALDLTAEQLMEVQILLSLVPAIVDWKNLAEFIGLTSGDISIIEHFCYTYRKLSTNVVLVHWLFKTNKHDDILPCNRDSLLYFVKENNRRDVLGLIPVSSH